MYHAQFVVRVVDQRQPLLPCVLAAHSRTSHGARKHLVIAGVEEVTAAAAEELLRRAGEAEGEDKRCGDKGCPMAHRSRSPPSDEVLLFAGRGSWGWSPSAAARGWSPSMVGTG